jgi:hypothetical protein
MTVTEYTVSDASGSITNQAGKIVGIPGDPFHFYVPNPAKNTDDKQEFFLTVQIVMPLGGRESGLFRYPRVGEKVLVGNEGNSRYLMGYIPTFTPSSQDFQTDGMFENDGKGEVFRYEQTGKKEPDEDDGSDRYSEIGFYHRETQWPTTNSNYKDVPYIPERGEDENGEKTENDEDYSKRLARAGYPKNEGEATEDHIKRVLTPTVFPAIDHLNIHSTGDIHTKALNHHLLKAKRFEVLVDCDDTIHTKAELEKDELPLGDNIGDDSVLHAGDAHIRAGNRVVIKAEEEIILQVGKTALKISDDSLDMISRIVNTNFTNAYDATFSMSKDGISMFGRDVNITSDKSFGIGDTFGGSVGSELGVVSIGGREIKAEVYDAAQYQTLVINALAQYLQSITSGSMAVNGKVSSTQVLDYIKFSFDTLNNGWELISNIIDVVREWKELEQKKREAAVAIGKKADEDAEEKKNAVDADAKEKTDQIDKEAEEAKRKLDLDKANGKITEAEAAKKKAEVEAEAAKKKADVAAEATKNKAEVAAEAAKKKAEMNAAEAKNEADKKAEDEKRKADDDLLAGTITAEDAKERKVKADADADKAKADADADEKAAKDKADADAEAAKKKADADAKAEKDKADATAKAEKDKADADAKAKKGSISSSDAEKAKADADAEAAKKKADADDKATKDKADADEKAEKAKADADAKATKAKADADAKATKDKADATAKAEKDKADATAKAEKDKVDADLKARTISDQDAKKAKDDADATAKKAKADADVKAADEKATAEKNKAEVAKVQADLDATAAKAKADADAAAAKKKADAAAAAAKKKVDADAAAGTISDKDAKAEKDKADATAKAEKDKADATAKAEKDKADADATAKKAKADADVKAADEKATAADDAAKAAMKSSTP